MPETIGSTPHALVDRVVKAIRSGDHSQNSFVRVDVKNFFPSISHAILAREMKHFAFSDTVRLLGMRAVATPICVDQVSIRDSSYRRMFKNILKVITDYRYRRDADRLIFRLNLKITGCVVDSRRRGWMMFFSHTEDLSQLAHLDAFIEQQLLRVNFPEQQISSIKRFIKSYHEIRFNLSDTQYTPNLDIFDMTDKVNAIVSLSSKSKEDVLAWDEQHIDQEFSRLISREVHDLEKDVGNPS